MPQPVNPTRWQATGVAAAVIVLIVGYAVAQDDPRNLPPGEVQPVELPEEERSELVDIAEEQDGASSGSTGTGGTSDGDATDGDTEGDTEGDGAGETDGGGEGDVTDGAGDGGTSDGTTEGGSGEGDAGEGG